MKKSISSAALGILVFLFSSSFVLSQKIETLDGVQTIHNSKSSRPDDKPGVSIQLIRRIGDIDTLDENLAFYFPSDIAMDATGNIYVLDSGNHRIQKFSREGRYQATFGRRGQGPGEFYNPDSMDIDARGYFYVLDAHQDRIQTLTPAGAADKSIRLIDRTLKEIRCLKPNLLVFRGSIMPFGFADGTKPPDLIQILDPDGKVSRSFVDGNYSGDAMKALYSHLFKYALDRNNHFYLSYTFHNTIEKYDTDGKIGWRADWPLKYPPPISSWKPDIAENELQACSVGLAVDDRDRVWVVTLARPLRKEEKVEESIFEFRPRLGGASTLTRTLKGNTDLRTSDSFRLEVFNARGVLLGGIPLTHFVDDIRIVGDNLFLLDQLHGATYYQYKIIEKK